jgi:hypothetical protein
MAEIVMNELSSLLASIFESIQSFFYTIYAIGTWSAQEAQMNKMRRNLDNSSKRIYWC